MMPNTATQLLLLLLLLLLLQFCLLFTEHTPFLSITEQQLLQTIAAKHQKHCAQRKESKLQKNNFCLLCSKDVIRLTVNP